MNKEIKTEVYCRECEHEFIENERDFSIQCPKCHSRNMHRSRFITCDCGEQLDINHFTNECECGKLYNNFGQELAPVNEWDPEDREACYGVQNINEDY